MSDGLLFIEGLGFEVKDLGSRKSVAGLVRFAVQG